MLPGGSVSVTARGNFPAGTTIISERDGVAISDAALSATTYSARLTIPPDEPPGFVRLWAFDPIGYSTTSPQAEIEAITTRMNDPKTTAAERSTLLVRLGEVQNKMLQGITSGRLQSDPASLNKEQDDFGCRLLQLYASRGGSVEGVFLCGKNFNDGALKVTGTMTQLR